MLVAVRSNLSRALLPSVAASASASRIVSKAVGATGVRSLANFTSNPFAAIRDGLRQFTAADIWKQIRSTRELKTGNLVGTDFHGNRYFENRQEQVGKDRWVVYAAHMDFDPATVPSEWHAWLHHMTDRLPAELDRPKYALDAPFDTTYKTGRDTTHRPPGHAMGGKAPGDGYLVKSGSIRTIRSWDPNAKE